MEIAPFVIVIALGMRVDEIIGAEFVEDGSVAVDHGPSAFSSKALISLIAKSASDMRFVPQ